MLNVLKLEYMFMAFTFSIDSATDLECIYSGSFKFFF